MPKSTHVTIVGVIFLFLVPLSLGAQDAADHASNPSSNNPQVMPAKISQKILVEHGFSFDDRKRDMCTHQRARGCLPRRSIRLK